jgi:hypothetical protein
MGWKVTLEHNRSKLNHITFLEDNKELGHFILNLNGEYEIRDISRTYHDVLSKPEKFIHKDKNIEFGKQEEN